MIKRLLKKIFQKSRLDEYAKILDLAIANGYILTSLSDWYEHDFYKGKKVLILRHDVDLNPKGAYKMFLLEKQRRIKSTYYFRWITANSKIIKKIAEEGFEVSLHYETLANQCKKRRIFSSSEVTDEIIIDCVEKLKKEIGIFEKRFGKIKTLCSHGDKRNRIIGIPNNKIIDGIPRQDLGIYFEAYDLSVTTKFNAYISDSSIHEKHRWKYGLTPEDAIQQGIECICLLTHPNHWSYSFSENISRTIVEFYDDFRN
jgi:hypothetical protein